jgi:membrane-associated HD superfamily phosphohydrolase
LLIFFYSEEKRETNVYVCVCVLLCWKRNKIVVFKRSFFLLSLKSFFVMWIVETIVCEYKKKKKRNLLCWQNSNIFLFNFILFSIIILFTFWNVLKFIFFVSSFCFIKMIVFNSFFLNRIMFMNRRWSLKHAKKWSKSRDI